MAEDSRSASRTPRHSRHRAIPSAGEVRWPASGKARSYERIPVGRLSAYLWALRSEPTWGKGGAHSGYRHLADKDEVPGSSPGRPTSPLSRRNADQLVRRRRDDAYAGSRPHTWLPLLVMAPGVQHCCSLKRVWVNRRAAWWRASGMATLGKERSGANRYSVLAGRLGMYWS